MKLREIMKEKVVSVLPDSPIIEAVRKMEEHNIGCLLVIQDGQVKGIITDRDIVMKVIAKGSDPTLTLASEVMQPNIIWGSPDMDILEASRLISTHQIRRLPVQEKGRIVGIVSITDLASVVQEEIDNLLSLRTVPAYR